MLDISAPRELPHSLRLIPPIGCETVEGIEANPDSREPQRLRRTHGALPGRYGGPLTGKCQHVSSLGMLRKQSLRVIQGLTPQGS